MKNLVDIDILFFSFVAWVWEEEVATSQFWWSVKLHICILLRSGKRHRGVNMMGMLLLTNPIQEGFPRHIPDFRYLLIICCLELSSSVSLMEFIWGTCSRFFLGVNAEAYDVWCVTLGNRTGDWVYIICQFAVGKFNQLQRTNMNSKWL